MQVDNSTNTKKILKKTEPDRNRQKRTETDRNGQKLDRYKLKYTETDRKGQKQKEMETTVINGQKRTEMTETDKNRHRCGEGGAVAGTAEDL